MAQAREGARRAGRPADAVDLPQLINVAMSDDGKVARRTARYVVTKYLGQQPHIGKANAIEPELLDPKHFAPRRPRLPLGKQRLERTTDHHLYQ